MRILCPEYHDLKLSPDAPALSPWFRMEHLVIPRNPLGQAFLFNESVAKFRDLSNLVSQRSDHKVRPIRVALMVRTEGRNGRRMFSNIDEVLCLIHDVFKVSEVRTLMITGATPLEEQARLYNWFDVLVGPVGSHNANMIFCRPNSVLVDLISETGTAIYDPHDALEIDHGGLSESIALEWRTRAADVGVRYYQWYKNHATKIQAQPPWWFDEYVANITALRAILLDAKKFVERNRRA